jgi:hypothetical protein
MAKAKLIKSFTHQGKTYKIGDEFEGTDAEIETLTGQGYVKRKEGEKPPESHALSAGPGSGVNVSASSSAGNIGDSFQRAAAAPKIAAKLKRK